MAYGFSNVQGATYPELVEVKRTADTALAAANTVEMTAVPSQTVEVAAADLPGYIASLPRLLVMRLTIKISGTLSETLSIDGFYGPGSLNFRGTQSHHLRDVTVSNCAVPVTFTFVGFEAPEAISGVSALISVNRSTYVEIHTCSISGCNKLRGVSVIGSTVVMIASGIKNCSFAVFVSRGGLLTIDTSPNYGTFENNTWGAYVWAGGIVLICDGVPELLGSPAHNKSGGIIAKADGTLV